MLSVSIAINGVVVMARSCVNTRERRGALTVYEVDDGSEVLHDPAEGAVALAAKLLGTIREPRGDGRG